MSQQVEDLSLCLTNLSKGTLNISEITEVYDFKEESQSFYSCINDGEHGKATFNILPGLNFSKPPTENCSIAELEEEDHETSGRIIYAADIVSDGKSL